MKSPLCCEQSQTAGNLDSDYVATWTFGGGLAISVVFIFMAFTVVDITRAFAGFGALMRRVFNRSNAGQENKDWSALVAAQRAESGLEPFPEQK